MYLVAHAASQPSDGGALRIRDEGVGHLGNRGAKASTALPMRQVGRAPHHAVDNGVGRVEADGPGCEPPHRVYGFHVLDHGVEELVDGGVELADDVRGDVPSIVEPHHLVVGIGGREEQVSVGEAEEAGVVEDGGAPVVGAQVLRVLEGGGDAGLAGGGVLVAAAYPDGVRPVRLGAVFGGGEEARGRGDVGG